MQIFLKNLIHNVKNKQQVYLKQVNFSLIFFPKASLANNTVKNKSCSFTFLSRINLDI